ncbi:hypothetical protein [Pseudomonas akapageensis]|nr:hypothetical protein [Pseudomonas akapageensis]
MTTTMMTVGATGTNGATSIGGTTIMIVMTATMTGVGIMMIGR